MWSSLFIFIFQISRSNNKTNPWKFIQRFLFFKKLFNLFLNVKKSPYLEQCFIPFFFLFPIFSCCTKSGDQPQVDLAKYDYKTNRHVENLDFLLHVGKPVEHMT